LIHNAGGFGVVSGCNVGGIAGWAGSDEQAANQQTRITEKDILFIAIYNQNK
jgi:hypothetical protein